MNPKQIGKWLAFNIAFQDDHLQYLGSLGLSRAEISTVLRYLVDGYYINPENHDEWDLDRALKDMNIDYWATRGDYAREYPMGIDFLPDWVEINWDESAANLLQDVEVIELDDNAIVTFTNR